MINFLLLEEKDITKKEKKYLCESGIILKDYDYIIITENINMFKKTLKNENPLKYCEKSKNTYIPKEKYIIIERLLNGCNKNLWYKAVFRKELKMIGVAYHG